MLTLLRLCYKLGLLKTYRQISRIRYVKRLEKRKLDRDNLYYIERDKAQYSATAGLLVFNRYEDCRYALQCNPRDLVERAILRGVFRGHILDYICLYAAEGSIVIDAGANVGAYSVPLATARPNVEVHAFEPHPQVAARLERNLRLNRLGNVKRHQVGLSDKSGKVMFNAVAESHDNLGLSSIGAPPPGVEASSVEIDIDTLDGLFPGKDKPISVVKIDVQGHELNVLRGGRALIERDHPVIIFEHEDVLFPTQAEAQAAKVELAEFFGGLGYEVFYMSHFDPSMLFPVKWDKYLEGDLLALPMIS